jgi:hypothetical protein
MKNNPPRHHPALVILQRPSLSSRNRIFWCMHDIQKSTHRKKNAGQQCFLI